MNTQSLKRHPWPTMRADTLNSGVFPLPYKQASTHSQNSERRFKTEGPIFSTPTITQDETIICGSADHTLYAYNPLNDSLEWSYSTKEAIDSAAAITPEGDIIVVSCDGTCTKLNAHGAPKWTFDVLRDRKQPTASSIYWWEGNIALDEEGNIYAGNDDFYLYSFTSDGVLRWQYPTGLNIWTTPVIWNDLVIFCSFDFFVYALRKDTGELVWKTKIDNFCVSSPAITSTGVVYFGTFGSTLYALDVSSGEVLRTTALKEHIYASPALDEENDALYIGDGSGVLYALSLSDFSEIWSSKLEGAIRASAAIDTRSDCRIYVADGGGVVYAFDTQGTQQWSYKVTDSNDPIPDICASVALGTHGVVVATISGDIVWIPYGCTQKETQNKISTTARDTHNWLPHTTHTLEITNVIFRSPSIISSFDLVAIASVTYTLVFSYDERGDITGTGEVTFGSDEGKDGVTIPRTLTYSLVGTMQKNGTFQLCAHDCMFELSAFPLPIDELCFRGKLQGGSVTQPSVRLFRKRRKGIQAIATLFSYQSFVFIWDYVAQLFMSRIFFTKPALLLKTSHAILRALHPSVIRGWRLTNTHGDIDASGTYTGRVIH